MKTVHCAPKITVPTAAGLTFSVSLKPPSQTKS